MFSLGDIGYGLKVLGLNGPTPGDEAKMKRLNQAGAGAMGIGDQAGGFAGQAQQNYGAMTGRLNGALDDLQAQAQGRNLVSTEMLRQGMQQGLGAQRSLAASAGPGNAAMAARNAANNMGRLSYGLSGQQALAGMQERNQAQQMYANAIGQARGQDLQGTLGGYNAASGAYGTAASAYGGGLNAQRDPTLAGQLAGGVAGAASIFGMGGAPAVGMAALKPIAAGYPGAGGYWTPGGK